MLQRIDELLKLSTVKIDTNAGSRGTGFFIGPGIILTCAHVPKEPLGAKIKLSSSDLNHTIEAEIVGVFLEDVDLAILVSDSPGCSDYCVYIDIDADIKPRDPCFTYGYTFHSNYGNSSGDPVTLECEGIQGGIIPSIKLKSGHVLPGLSGSPLLNQRTSKVCGIIRNTRDERFDLGGEAIPISVILAKIPALSILQKDFHTKDPRWHNLLTFDIDPFDSDWSYIDESSKKQENYFKTLIFLVKVLVKWIILGRKAPRAFPIETIRLLITHTFQGDLGQEIKRQRKQLTRDLTFKLDFEGTNQARIINQLDSQAWILGELIDKLIDDKQDLASLSRLSWATEILYEQRGLFEELKKEDGNYYPDLEKIRRRPNSLDDNSKYTQSDRAIGRLISKYSASDSILWKSIQLGFNFSISSNLVNLGTKNSLIYVEKVSYILYLILKINLDVVSRFEISVDDIFDDLEVEIRRNPKLKILRKVQILLQSAVGERVEGGNFRAWNTSGSYHFSRKCKLYPERAKPDEMKKILCFSTSDEAEEAGHQACKNCKRANDSSLDENFVGDET